ncbi:polysaccharide biosynthesis tyrosine autokinase [Nakamurella sp.]|uniref:polysaccharide biosynthesis tyrosine autokinase n=1 Tax=Nakamurella sp. TaxID=1869182 RepID=UPI003B3B8C39
MEDGLLDLRQFMSALRKGWWLILICMIVGLGLAFGYNLKASPKYSSSVTFFVSTPTGDGTSLLAADQFATRRITSYVGLMSSDLVAQRIVTDMNLDIEPSSVAASIDGEADLNTVLLTATVTDSSPERSLLIAQGLAKDFGSIVNQVDPIGPGQVELRVISGPTLNPVPVAPRKTVNLALGLLGGAIVGLVVALLREVLDNTVRQVATLRELARVPLLGAIPYDKDAKRAPLIDRTKARSIRAEAFRQLRTNLQFVDVDRPVHSLVVTSSVPHEAKSTTATNLAVSFAESGRRVLLIEADLRRPRVADYLGLERSVGLTSVLTGAASLDDAIQPWGATGMSFLASGPIPPNPSELLGSAAMASLLKSLRRSFDIMIIDTPPLLPVTDAAVTAKLVDGAVLVVRHGKTRRTQIHSALRSLRSVDARILGTVFNMVPIRGADGYESYAGGYYEETPKKNTPRQGQDGVGDGEAMDGGRVVAADGVLPDFTIGTAERPGRPSRLQPRRPTS